jgi:hypothetical protein
MTHEDRIKCMNQDCRKSVPREEIANEGMCLSCWDKKMNADASLPQPAPPEEVVLPIPPASATLKPDPLTSSE